MSRPIAVALVGACGRMGAEVARVVSASGDCRLAYRVDPALERSSEPVRGGPDLSDLAPGSIDGIIDFSSPSGAVQAAEDAARIGCALVSGTTGLDSTGLDRLRAVAARVPVCWSPNFSLGIPLLAAAIREAARRLPRDWQIEIAEIHHAAKKDAPSGTALRLAEVWRGERGGRFVHGREGVAGPREEGEIGLHAIRLGAIVGEHRVLLGAAGEAIEVVHRMQDRSAFAAGSVEALRRLLREGPGWHEWESLLLRS